MSQGRFRFRLQRLLSLRERTERDAALALAKARSLHSQLVATEQDLLESSASARRASVPEEGTIRNLGDMRAAALLAARLEAGVLETRVAEAEAEQGVTEAIGRHSERLRDRRALERLRERKLVDWRLAQDRADREAMDSLARSAAARGSSLPTEE